MSTQNDQRPTDYPMEQSAAFDQQGGVVGAVQGAQQAVKETTRQTIEAASQTAQELAHQTAQQATDVVTQAADQVTDALAEAKQQATTAFTKQRDSAIASLSALADALRDVGDRLGETSADGTEVPASIGPIVQDAANRLAQSADFLRNKDASSLLKEARDLAQRRPMLFIGSMFAIGLAGARILKETTADGAGVSAQSSGQTRTPMAGPDRMRELPESQGAFSTGADYRSQNAAEVATSSKYGSHSNSAEWAQEGVQE